MKGGQRYSKYAKNRSEKSPFCEGEWRNDEVNSFFFWGNFTPSIFLFHDWVLVAIRGQFHLQFPAMWGRGSVELPLLRSKLSGMVHEVGDQRVSNHK